MKTLKFTDPTEKYEGFKNVELKLDVESTDVDNCTILEVTSENLDVAISIGLNVTAPMVTTINSLVFQATQLELKVEVVEDSVELN